MSLKELTTPSKHWHRDFKAVVVDAIAEPVGNAIADEIERTRKEGRKLAIILPVGPVNMYHTVINRLRRSGTHCDHVTTFNMDNSTNLTKTSHAVSGPAGAPLRTVDTEYDANSGGTYGIALRNTPTTTQVRASRA